MAGNGERISALLSETAAANMALQFITRLHPSKVRGDMITVSADELTTLLRAVIEVTVNNTLDAMPDVIEDAVRRMENATNDK